MILQVKVKVRLETLKEFAGELMAGNLDRSSIISDTYCEKENPVLGLAIGELMTWMNSMKNFQPGKSIMKKLKQKG